MGLFRKLVGEPGPKMVRVHVARHEAEQEMILSLLHAAQIPARAQHAGGFYNADASPIGPRDILVPEHLEHEARAVIAPVSDAEDAASHTDDAR